MIRIFRKLRLGYSMKDSGRKYLIYALGEVFLVVIGILIALQVNNWNEQRKNIQNIHHIFQGIQDDLISDIEETELVSNWYAERDLVVERIISGAYENKLPEGFERTLLFQTSLFWFPFTVNRSSFDNLAQNQSILPAEYQRLYKALDQLYTQQQRFLDTQQSYIAELVEQYRNYLFDNKEWILDYKDGWYTREAIQYFTSSDYHKRRVARYDQLADNLKETLDIIHRTAIINYLMIEAKVPSERPTPKDVKSFIRDVPEDVVPGLEGYYIHVESGTPLEIWRSGKLYMVVSEERTLIDSNTYIIASNSGDTLNLDRNQLRILPEKNASGKITGIHTFFGTQSRGLFRRTDQ